MFGYFQEMCFIFYKTPKIAEDNGKKNNPLAWK